MTQDIRNRIEADFGIKANEVIHLFHEAFAKAADIRQDRIVRCIVFLADRNIEKLKANIDAAIRDPRDIIYWAEYDNHNQLDNTIRLRDFNYSFDNSELQGE